MNAPPASWWEMAPPMIFLWETLHLLYYVLKYGVHRNLSLGPPRLLPAVSVQGSPTKHQPVVEVYDSITRHQPALEVYESPTRYQPAVILQGSPTGHQPAVVVYNSTTRHQPAADLSSRTNLVTHIPADKTEIFNGQVMFDFRLQLLEIISIWDSCRGSHFHVFSPLVIKFDWSSNLPLSHLYRQFSIIHRDQTNFGG